jgi:hypothetical protein
VDTILAAGHGPFKVSWPDGYDETAENISPPDSQPAPPANGSSGAGKPTSEAQRDATATPRAVFNGNVTLDASLDVEKLEKQLALLRKYGAL